MNQRLLASFKNSFGPPKVVEYAGLAIYTECVRVVKLRLAGEDWVSVLVKEYPVDRPEKLGKVLKFINSDSQLEGVGTVVVIPADKTQTTQIELADVSETEAQYSLPWQVKDLISISPQDMVCDFISMDIQPSGQAPKAQIIATHRSYLEHILKPLHEDRVPVTAISTEQFVLACMQNTKDTAQLLFVQHAGMAATLLILKNRQICFARKIRGTESVINLIEQDVREYGAEMIAIEIQRSIDYYESQLKQPPIKDALVAMSGSNEQLIADLLDATLPVRTKVIPYNTILDETGDMSLPFLTAYGAALNARQEGEA